MEIIILAVIAFIFNLVTKGKGGDNKSKPFMERPLNQQPKKRIEDYAKEVYQDVQKQIAEKQTNPRGKVVDTMSERKLEKMARAEISKVEEAPKRSGRLSVHNPTAVVREKKASTHSLLPKTGNDLIQAIVFSEILAPPKSKR